MSRASVLETHFWPHGDLPPSLPGEFGNLPPDLPGEFSELGPGTSRDLQGHRSLFSRLHIPGMHRP